MNIATLSSSPGTMNAFTANKMDALFTANKPKLDMSRDDTSSVTSKSSGNMSGVCKGCGDPESLPSKPLIKCPSCQVKRYHAHCDKPHDKPPIDPRNIPKDWKCKACRKKETAAADPSLAVPSNSRPGPSSNNPSEPAVNMRGRICKESGCTNPIFQSNLPLCHIHKMAQQAKRAAEMKPSVSNVPSGSKPIRKKSLYNFKLDDDMKHLKRKRPSPAKRSSSDAAISAMTSSSVATQRPVTQEGRNSSVPDAFQSGSTPMRTPQQRAAQFNLLAGMGSDRSPDDMNTSLGSASMAESPVSLLNADLEGDFFILQSARRTPRTTQPPTSPEYSPPPPVEMPADELNTLWAEPEQESPGSQIHQELRATVDESEDGVVRESSEQQLPPTLAALNSIQQQRERDEETAATDEQANGGGEEDEAMPDAPEAFEEGSLPNSGTAPTMVSPSPALTSVSSSTTPGEDIIYDADTNIGSCVSGTPESLEERRKHIATTFDTSVLDSFLTIQAEAETELDLQPTPQELLETQMWGHINPEKIWPKETSEDWLAQKRREIDARGGRKANFGKNLTAQVRKERKDKGWQIHQNSEAVDKKIMDETAIHMEELFGIKGIDDLIPGVRDGQLVMMEPPEQDGKKKRKIKAYPVF